MNDSELDKILKAAKEPSRPGEYWDDFPKTVTMQLQRPRRSEITRPGWRTALALGLSFAAACLVAGFFIGHWNGRHEAASNSLLQNEQAVRKVLAMFPHQVRAIVQDEHGLNFVLSEHDDVPDSQPLYVRICDGKNCTSLVTFSGQEVQVAGQKITALLDAKGGVILMGDRFFWSGDEPEQSTGGLRVEARQLRAG